MGEHETGRLIYLVLLGGALLTYMLVSNRAQMGSMLRGTVLWALIFIGVIAAVGLWEDLRQTVAPSRAVSFGQGSVTLPRDPSGHFFLTLEVQGTPVRFVVDTGATHMVLSRRDALRVGIDPDALVYTGRAQTANGTVRTARVSLAEVALGDFVDTDVTAWVNEGELELSLLGMSYLSRFERIEIERGRLVLTR
jgi:aspartyl protease family protein